MRWSGDWVKGGVRGGGGEEREREDMIQQQLYHGMHVSFFSFFFWRQKEPLMFSKKPKKITLLFHAYSL